MKHILQKLLLLTVLLVPGLNSISQGTSALTVDDMMKFRQIQSPLISPDGEWVLFTARPDRGDSEVQICSGDGEVIHRLERGEKPAISNDGNWVTAVQSVSALESINSEKGKAPLPGLILLDTRSGEKEIRDSVGSFAFSNNSSFLAFHRAEKSSDKDESGHNKTGSTLILRSLENGKEYRYPFVCAYAMDSVSLHLAMVISDSSGLGNGVHMADLKNLFEEPIIIYQDSSAWAGNLTWNNKTGQLAFLAGLSGEKNSKSHAELHLWSPGTVSSQVILKDKNLEEGWKVYHTNKLKWSLDGSRLFLGIKPESEIISPEEEKDSVENLYSSEEILAERGVDVWHWNDPLINSQQKKQWKSEKDRTYTGVFHLEEKRFIQLADLEMPGLSISDNAIRLLGHSNKPYAKEQTWDGRYQDYYLVDLQTGERKVILKHHGQTVRLSPDGQQLVYYHNKQWYMMETATLETRNLTEELGVPFEDEDWDYPEAVPGYGVAGWIDQSASVMIYDKYDIWLFPSDGGQATCLTRGKGRKEKYQFRIKILDKEKKYLESGEDIFLSAYHDLKKHTALYKMKTGEEGLQMIFDEIKKYTLLTRARDEDVFLYSRQSYREFPDLWISDKKFKRPLRLTDVNPQVADFAWGSAQLVEWNSVDGAPLQGILILPDNAEPGKTYPVLVYYYRFFTNRLYDFNHVAVNHRPCFPFYASNGYAVFLPDIRFDIGIPGYSATKCLVPGVQKIINMGVADPEAICLHGHSWSGYQTAFAITQTDIFTCAIAGAPVSNMTSAYSGIRWESGRARQFQYEKSQSRIGGSLWEARDKYIENSPVFFADRISTPLLIQFGDVDGAVPWYQGIELYLAMRRLEKDCIFLQYRDEGHHLKKYANKLDYTLKFKEYLDHYLKGDAAADWIKAGIPYQGQ